MVGTFNGSRKSDGSLHNVGHVLPAGILTFVGGFKVVAVGPATRVAEQSARFRLLVEIIAVDMSFARSFNARQKADIVGCRDGCSSASRATKQSCL